MSNQRQTVRSVVLGAAVVLAVAALAAASAGCDDDPYTCDYFGVGLPEGTVWSPDACNECLCDKEEGGCTIVGCTCRRSVPPPGFYYLYREGCPATFAALRPPSPAGTLPFFDACEPGCGFFIPESDCVGNMHCDPTEEGCQRYRERCHPD